MLELLSRTLLVVDCKEGCGAGLGCVKPVLLLVAYQILAAERQDVDSLFTDKFGTRAHSGRLTEDLEAFL